MDPFDVDGGQVSDAAQPVNSDDTPEAGSTASSVLKWHGSAPHVHSTRGGSGSAAGATPKKTYRPSRSSRHRPAGKKPHDGNH